MRPEVKEFIRKSKEEGKVQEEIKEYPKELIWYNHKYKKEEPIPLMPPKNIAYKVRLLESKIQDHSKQLTQLKNLRMNLLNELKKRGKRLTTQKSMKEHRNIVVLVNEDQKPIVTKYETLKQAEDFDIPIAAKAGLIIEFPDTRRSDDL